ncbi:MAG: ATP synthase subunit I [Alphaproteobacteria bacterium]|nr:ATP synthase subunit I [Alphaproteobacteria bacterium]
MNFNAFKLSLSEFGTCFLIGAICGLIFMYLLWRTVKLLPQVKHKYLFLFVSKALRIFLLLCVMILFSDHHAGKFLTIFCGFWAIRLIILKFVSFRVYHETEEKQLLKGMKKKKK